MARAEHRHGRPTAGIVLTAVGFSLVIFWFLLLPFFGPLAAFGLLSPTAVTPQLFQILPLVALIGFVLAMAGVIVGLASVRSRGAT